MRSGHLATPEEWLVALTHLSVWLRAGRRSPETIGLRLSHMRAFGRATKLHPYEVTLEDLLAYLSSKKWARSTQNSHRASLRCFYGWAEATGRMTSDPSKDLPAITTERGRPRPAPEEALIIGLNATDERVRLMVNLAASAGLRCGEIAQGHTRDITQDLFGWSLLVHGKGDKIRIIPLNDHLAVQLRSIPSGWFFPGQDHGHLSAHYVSKLVSRALPQGYTAHMLRHRFASVAYAADRDIRAVQELLGHASVATTQIYTAIPDGALRRAVAAAS